MKFSDVKKELEAAIGCLPLPGPGFDIIDGFFDLVPRDPSKDGFPNNPGLVAIADSNNEIHLFSVHRLIPDWKSRNHG